MFYNEKNYWEIVNKLISTIENYIINVYRSHKFILHINQTDISLRIKSCVTNAANFIVITEHCDHVPENYQENSEEYNLALTTLHEREKLIFIGETLKEISATLTNDLDYEAKIEQLKDIIACLKAKNLQLYQDSKYKTPHAQTGGRFGEALRELDEIVKKLLEDAPLENKLQTTFFVQKVPPRNPQELLKNFEEFTKLFNVKFFMDGPENIKIRELRSKGDSSIHYGSRFANNPIETFPFYEDKRFKYHNANQYPEGYFITEGVPQDDIRGMQDYLKDLFFNHDKSVSITDVLVCGLPDEGKAKFHDYFSTKTTQIRQYGSYQIKSTLLSDKGTACIDHYRLTITDTLLKENTNRNTDLWNIKKMPDHQTADLSEKDYQLLFELQNKVQPENMAAHCAGGLGRSPTMLFTFALYKKYDEIFVGSDEMIVKRIEAKLHEYREIRPASIQQESQLHQAVWLALQYKKIENTLKQEVQPEEGSQINVIFN